MLVPFCVCISCTGGGGQLGSGFPMERTKGLVWAGHPLLPSAEVTNEWSYTSVPLLCLRGMSRGFLYLTFTHILIRTERNSWLSYFNNLSEVSSYKCLVCEVSDLFKWVDRENIRCNLIRPFIKCLQGFCSKAEQKPRQ